MVKRISDEEFDRQFAEATARGEERLRTEPRAESVAYDSKADRIRVELSNGCTFMFPPDIAQGLRGATAEKLSDVEICGGGLDLHWRTLDAQFDVTNLLAGIFGTRAWMAELRSASGVSAGKADLPAADKINQLEDRPRVKRTA